MNSEKNLKNPNKSKDPIFYNFGYDLVKITGALPALLWLRPKIHYPFGKPCKKGRLMVTANHRTMIDPILVQMAFPLRRMNSLATKDLFSSKIMSFFLHQVHCIVVDKENFSLRSFHEVVRRLEQEKMVVIFPEGRLNNKGAETLLAFKSGAILMAHKAKAPIIPLYIVRRKKWYQRLHIVMGPAFDITELLGAVPSMEKVNHVCDLLREKEVELRAYFEALPLYEKFKISEKE